MVGFWDYLEYVRTEGINRHIVSIIVAFPFFALSGLFRSLRQSELNFQEREVPAIRIMNFQAQTREVSDNFIKNMRYMEVLCREHNAVFLSVLQPVNGIGKRQLTAEDIILISKDPTTIIQQSNSQLNFKKECFSYIKRECSPNTGFVDFTTVFDNETKQIFFDTVHFSDRGNRIVAEALRDVLVRKGLK